MSGRMQWVLLAGVTLVLILCAAFLPSFSVKKQSLQVENFPKIAVGMTLKEVEKLLGGPPGNYGILPLGSAEMTQGSPHLPGTVEKQWHNENHMLEIYFDSKDQVAGFYKRASYKQYPPESWLSRFWRFIGISGTSP